MPRYHDEDRIDVGDVNDRGYEIEREFDVPPDDDRMDLDDREWRGQFADVTDPGGVRF